MKLVKVNYYENKDNPNYWEIQDVLLNEQFNLIIGKNATGKTRFKSVLTGISGMLSGKRELSNGYFDFNFIDYELQSYNYKLDLLDKKVTLEEFEKNNKILLKRNSEKTTIFSKSAKNSIEIEPPENKLTLTARQDKKDYPFLEELRNWANNFYSLSFSSFSPNDLKVPILSKDKEITPSFINDDFPFSIFYVLDAIKEDTTILNSIVNDMNEIGYSINNADTQKLILGDNLLISPIIPFVKEIDLKCNTDLLVMSKGMLSALATITLLEYLLIKNQDSTLFIDDLGEGLDYERSSKLTLLLRRKLKDKKIQLIATSNDRFLINNVDLESINVLERKGSLVKSYNYQNSKEHFDRFSRIGLSNFDLLVDEMYKEYQAD